MELLGDDDICRNLDSNSVQRDRSGDKVTWTSVFKDATEYFAKVISTSRIWKMISFVVIL